MATENEDKELKLREEADGSVIVDDGSTPAPKAPEASPKGDDTTDKDGALASHEEDHDDEPGSDGETEEDAEARRERNRQRRKENKERRKEYIDSLKRELASRDELLNRAMSRLDAIERRTQSADLAMVDAELQKASEAYNYYKQVHSDAVSNKDGAAATDAQEKMFTAMRRAEQLSNIKESAKKQSNQPAPPPLDPRLKANAESWLEKNSWFNPDGDDEDSEIVRTLDRRLAQEGWDPTTPQYWEELEKRTKKYLPHRTNMTYNRGQGSNNGSPRAPVAGSGRESGNPSSGGYKLSADRVQALKDAGMWDDPAARAKMIKRYQELDKMEGAR